jgi:hypothetical protein
MPHFVQQPHVTWTDVFAYTLAVAVVIASPYIFTSITVTVPVSEIVAIFVALNMLLWRMSSQKKKVSESTQ